MWPSGKTFGGPCVKTSMILAGHFSWISVSGIINHFAVSNLIHVNVL